MNRAEEYRDQLQDMAKEIVSRLSELESGERKLLLSDFVTELYFTLAEQERREVRKLRQAEGIAAAKARGVHFGRQAGPLPEDFEEMRRAFRAGELSLRQAAERCGMPRTTFHNAVVREEQSAV